MMNGEHFYRIDTNYPNKSKNVDSPGVYESRELLPTRLSGEVELIASASYRLGAAETMSQVYRRDADNSQKKVADLEEKLERSTNSERYAKQERDRYEETAEKLDAENTKLKAKLAPKKKKTAKKGGKK